MIPVIGDLDPKYQRDLDELRRTGLTVVFAGKDKPLVAEMRRIFEIVLPDEHVLVLKDGAGLTIVLPVTEKEPGLVIYATKPEGCGPGDLRIEPTLIAWQHHEPAWNNVGWKAQDVIDAIDMLLLVRVLPPAGGAH